MDIKKFYKAFEYPFGFINYDKCYKEFNIENFTLTLFDNKLKSERIDLTKINFPKDIKKVYWYDKGINDKKPWQVICKLRSNRHTFYVYYLAGCDYTGFDCQGYMKMYISKSFKKLLNLAIPSKLFNNPKIRKLIIKSNK